MSEFDKHFKGNKGEWLVAGQGLNTNMILQSDDKGAIGTVFGTGKKANANAKLIAQSKPMARMLFDLVMARKDQGEENLSLQERSELIEAERILKLILK
jgi:hypothetical protein